MRYILFTLIASALLISCDSGKMTETPDSQFEGNWKVSGRSMFEGIEVEIVKDDEGNFTGAVSKLNENKFVLMFMEVGDKFVSGIRRNSNFEFVLSEKKIAAPLFSAYGQGTTTSFDVTFDGKDKILLGEEGNSGTYIRVK
jgi:hypothetical protein